MGALIKYSSVECRNCSFHKPGTGKHVQIFKREAARKDVGEKKIYKIHESFVVSPPKGSSS